MSAVIKTPEEIEKMRVAGRLAADVLEMIEPHVNWKNVFDEHKKKDDLADSFLQGMYYFNEML